LLRMAHLNGLHGGALSPFDFRAAARERRNEYANPFF